MQSRYLAETKFFAEILSHLFDIFKLTLFSVNLVMSNRCDKILVQKQKLGY